MSHKERKVRVADESDGPRSFTIGEKLLLALVVIYVISPADILPVALFGPLGITDDLTALALGYKIWKRRDS